MISDSSVFFSKSSLYIWNFSVQVLLKPSLKDFEHYLTSIQNEYNCVVIWTFFGLVFLWDWNEKWPFPVLWPLLSFPSFPSHCSTLTASSFRIWNSSAGIPSPPLALLIVMPHKSQMTSHSRMSRSRWVIHRPSIPSSYGLLFFTTSDVTFTTRHIQNWVSFLLWPILFILSGTISLFFPSRWTPSHLVGLSSHVIFLPFHAVHGVLEARIL